MVGPDLISQSHDGLALVLVICHHLWIIVRRSVAEYPDSRLVVEVGLNEHAFNSLLRDRRADVYG